MNESKEKLGDMRARQECLELMKWAMWKYKETKKEEFLTFAKDMGAISKKYAEQIKGDYTERDKRWASINELFASKKV